MMAEVFTRQSYCTYMKWSSISNPNPSLLSVWQRSQHKVHLWKTSVAEFCAHWGCMPGALAIIPTTFPSHNRSCFTSVQGVHSTWWWVYCAFCWCAADWNISHWGEINKTILSWKHWVGCAKCCSVHSSPSHCLICDARRSTKPDSSRLTQSHTAAKRHGALAHLIVWERDGFTLPRNHGNMQGL